MYFNQTTGYHIPYAIHMCYTYTPPSNTTIRPTFDALMQLSMADVPEGSWS